MTKSRTKKKGAPVSKSSTKKQRITFRVESPQAREVFLVGDFNQWNPSTHPMKPVGDGFWEKTLLLQPGTYEYKLVVDGDWRLDAGNEEIRENCFGTQNNVIQIRRNETA